MPKKKGQVHQQPVVTKTLIIISDSAQKVLESFLMKFFNRTKIRKITVFSNMKKINNKFPFFNPIIRDTKKLYNTKFFSRKRYTDLNLKSFL